jgi:hypothetical protein
MLCLAAAGGHFQAPAEQVAVVELAGCQGSGSIQPSFEATFIAPLVGRVRWM